MSVLLFVLQYVNLLYGRCPFRVFFYVSLSIQSRCSAPMKPVVLKMR